MVDIPAARRRYLVMGADPVYRFVALIGIQCCEAAEQNCLVRFNPQTTGWGSTWDDPTKFAPPEVGPTIY